MANEWGDAPPAAPNDWGDKTVGTATPAPVTTAGDSSGIGAMLKEYWNKINPVAGAQGLVHAVAHPIEAGKAYLQQTDQLRQAAEDSFSKGDYVGGIRHAFSYFANGIPGVGQALDEAGNKAASGDHAGAIADTAALATNLFGPKIAEAGLGAVSRAAPTAADALKSSAAENYRSILLPTKKAVPRAEATAAGLAEETPVALTQKGLLERAAQEKATAGPAAAAAYAGKPPITEPELQPIFDDLEALRAKHATVNAPGGTVVTNKPFNDAVDAFESKLQEMQDRTGNGPAGSVPAEVLDDWRDKLFRGQVDANGNLKTLNPTSAKSLEKATANSVRNVLDSKYPDSKALNDTFKLWANTYDFLEDARRATIASQRGLNVGSSQGFGALVQRLLPRPVREIPANVAGVFDTVAWNTVNGAMKSSIADALSAGNWNRAKFLLKSVARVPAAANVVSPALQPATATQR